MAEDKKKTSDALYRRMEYLTDLLNRASEAYYARDTEIMPNLEYDALYDELRALEEETGIVMAGSPTVSVGYAAVEELPRVRHEQPMLSLDKTKSREDLAAWLGDQKGLLSWKLDGLTVVLTYENGRLLFSDVYEEPSEDICTQQELDRFVQEQIDAACSFDPL